MTRCIRCILALAIPAILAGFGCIAYSPGGPKVIPKAITLMISSNTVSNYTPCGCHSGQWGGMPRRGTIFKEIEDSVAWPVLFVDTGDVSQGSTSEQYALKDKYVFQAYGVIGYDIVNVGLSDLRLGQAELLKAGQDNGIPWTSANTFSQGVMPELEVNAPRPGAVNPPGSTPNPPGAGNPATGRPTENEEDWAPVPPDTLPAFTPYRIVEPDPVNSPGFKVGLIGAMVQDPMRLNMTTNFSFQHYIPAIREQVQALKSQHVDLIILVCDADNFDNVDRAKAFEGIDIVIGGNARREVSPNAQLNPENPSYRTANTTGQPNQSTAPNPSVPAAENEAGSTGEAVIIEPLDLPQIFPKAGSRGRLVNRVDIFLDSTGRIIDYYINQDIRVDNTRQDDPMMAEVSRGYDTDVLTDELVRTASSAFVGSQTCEGCHPGFLVAWAGTGHFKSYQTIVEGNALDDRSCTECHALGFVSKPRLLTYDLVPEEFRNVGCEGCHAGGKNHMTQISHLAILSPADRALNTAVDPMSSPINQSTCLECHKGEWGANFDFDTAMEAARETCRSVSAGTLTYDQIRGRQAGQ